jgi:GTP-binding protein EngB required for normal cell division
MASAVNKLHTYTGLEASPLSGAHQLYFAPLEDLHKVFRTDGSTNVVVVTFIGRTNHSKSLLANLMVDHTVFLVRHSQQPDFAN